MSYFLVPLLSLCLLCAEAHAGNSYVALATNPDMNTSELRVWIDDDSRVVSYSGVMSRFSGCVEDEMLCLNSGVLVFAVPKARDLAEKKWEYSGYKFDSSGIRTIEVLGRMLAVYRITARDDVGVRNVFYYSCEAGLVAFSERQERLDFQLAGFISTGAVGWGAWCGSSGP